MSVVPQVFHSGDLCGQYRIRRHHALPLFFVASLAAAPHLSELPRTSCGRALGVRSTIVSERCSLTTACSRPGPGGVKSHENGVVEQATTSDRNGESGLGNLEFKIQADISVVPARHRYELGPARSPHT
jgi:hypothetical protein